MLTPMFVVTLFIVSAAFVVLALRLQHRVEHRRRYILFGATLILAGLAYCGAALSLIVEHPVTSASVLHLLSGINYVMAGVILCAGLSRVRGET